MATPSLYTVGDTLHPFIVLGTFGPLGSVGGSGVPGSSALQIEAQSDLATLCSSTLTCSSVHSSKRGQVWMPYFQPHYWREKLCAQVRILLQVHAEDLMTIILMRVLGGFFLVLHLK